MIATGLGPPNGQQTTCAEGVEKMEASYRLHVRLTEEQEKLFRSVDPIAPDGELKDLKRELFESFAADPFLKQFARKEFRVELGHPFPVQLHIQNPGISSSGPAVMLDRRIVGHSQRVAMITARIYFSLPEGHQVPGLYQSFKLKNHPLPLAAFVSWEGSRYCVHVTVHKMNSNQTMDGFRFRFHKISKIFRALALGGARGIEPITD